MGSYHPEPGWRQSRRGFLGTAGLFGVGIAAIRGRVLRFDNTAEDRGSTDAPASSNYGVIVAAQNLTFETGRSWRPVSLVVHHHR
jgi:hypothetical protein